MKSVNDISPDYQDHLGTVQELVEAGIIQGTISETGELTHVNEEELNSFASENQDIFN